MEQTHAEIDSFISSAGANGGLALLDSSGVLKSTEIPNSVIKSINSKTTSNNVVTLNIADINDASVTSVSNNQGLIYNSTDSKWENKQIDQRTLSNIGSNTHAQIDSFIATKKYSKWLCWNKYI